MYVIYACLGESLLPPYGKPLLQVPRLEATVGVEVECGEDHRDHAGHHERDEEGFVQHEYVGGRGEGETDQGSILGEVEDEVEGDKSLSEFAQGQSLPVLQCHQIF